MSVRGVRDHRGRGACCFESGCGTWCATTAPARSRTSVAQATASVPSWRRAEVTTSRQRTTCSRAVGSRAFGRHGTPGVRVGVRFSPVAADRRTARSGCAGVVTPGDGERRCSRRAAGPQRLWYFGCSKLDAMLGKAVRRRRPLYHRDVVEDGAESRRETVTGIDPAARRVCGRAITSTARSPEPSARSPRPGACVHRDPDRDCRGSRVVWFQPALAGPAGGQSVDDFAGGRLAWSRGTRWARALQFWAMSLAPSRVARPTPPWRMTWLWFHANAGRGRGPSAFIHRFVVRTRHS